MPAQFTMPPDTRAVGTGNPPADMNGVVDALNAMGATANILNAAYAGGADPTGAADSTAAFNAALAALPTTTIYATPPSGGASAVVHYGTLIIPAGTFKIGSLGADTNNIGPLVNVIGTGATAQGVTPYASACMLAYYGSGDCLRAFNPVKPSSDTFDTESAWGPKLDGFVIDGTNALPGAAGLHAGDMEGCVLGPGLAIQNFSQGLLTVPTGLGVGANVGGGTFAANTYFWKIAAASRAGETTASTEVSVAIALNGTASLTWTAVPNAASYKIYRGTVTNTENLLVAVVAGGATVAYTDTGSSLYGAAPSALNTSANTGLWLDNSVSWTEANWGRCSIFNCGNAVRFTVTTGDDSFEYNDLTFKIYLFPNQNGIVLQNGVKYTNGRLVVRGNVATSSSVMSSAFLAVIGNAPDGAFSHIFYTRLDIQCETNLALANGPRTILLGNQFSTNGVPNNAIQQCFGSLVFLHTGWTLSNWSVATGAGAFNFTGFIFGDTNLHVSGGGASWIAAGSMAYGQAKAFQSGTTLICELEAGDFSSFTLTQSVTIQLCNTALGYAGPQRKTIVLTQAAGGGFTVTWPKPGSPTVATPAIYWAAGAAPTMSAGASAVDVYKLETYDGIHWHGSASQAMS